MEELGGEEDKEHEKTCFAVFHGCYVEIHLFFVNLFFFWYVLDIDVTKNGNNSKLKVKSEFSLSMGLMLINHSKPYIHSTTLLCDTHVRILNVCACVYTCVAGSRTSEGDFTYSSVAVNRDGSRLEHRGVPPNWMELCGIKLFMKRSLLRYVMPGMSTLVPNYNVYHRVGRLYHRVGRLYK